MLNALLLLPAVLASAAADQPFSTACDYYKCVPQIAAIESGFQRQGEVLATLAPAIYSGVCRHLSPDYKQEDEHHGFVLLERREGESAVFFSGQFSFFEGYDSWRDWDLARARREIAERFKTKVTGSGRYSIANPGAPYPDVAYQYWLSQDASSGELYVIGAWGPGRRLYCRFARRA
jgi:hypothetical protein